MDQTLTIIIFTGLMIGVAYLFGSISSAVLICRLIGLPDPRTEGSCNPGATNVLRIGGPAPAIATLLFDVLKGTLPVYGSYYIGLPPLSLGLIAVSACLGHMFPCFFELKGGKAVATALGSIGPIGWDMTGLLLGTWLITAVIGRYSSLASLVTVVLAPVYAFWLKPEYTLPVLMLSALMVWRHRANIQRLVDGTEPYILDKTQRQPKQQDQD